MFNYLKLLFNQITFFFLRNKCGRLFEFSLFKHSNLISKMIHDPQNVVFVFLCFRVNPTGKMKTLKITACFLLLFHVLHLASLQTTTDSPGRTIDKSWLRKPFINTGEQSEFDTGLETEFGNDNSGGIPSGFMAENTEEEENLANQFRSENETSDVPNISNNTLHSVFQNETTKQAELPQAAIPPANASTESTNSSQTNMTEAEDELSFTKTTENSTNTQNLSKNNTALESTTLAPENSTTKQPTTTLDLDKSLANSTGSTSTAAPTTVEPNTTGSTIARASTAGPNTTTPEINKTTTANPFEIPESSMATTTDVVNVPNVANRSGVVADGSERGTGAQSGNIVIQFLYCYFK